VTLHRYAKQRDANEPQIVRLLLAAGYSVKRIDVPCDLYVGRNGVTHLVEIKMPGERLTPAQVRAKQEHRGCFHVAYEGQELIAELRQCLIEAKERP